MKPTDLVRPLRRFELEWRADDGTAQAILAGRVAVWEFTLPSAKRQLVATLHRVLPPALPISITQLKH